MKDLPQYEVLLIKAEDAPSISSFVCDAESEFHALEQAETAYPDCELIDCYRLGYSSAY
jgi:hypothetical protein